VQVYVNAVRADMLQACHVSIDNNRYACTTCTTFAYISVLGMRWTNARVLQPLLHYRGNDRIRVHAYRKPC